MTTTVKHKFVSAKADGTNVTLVKPTNWNDTHDMTTNTTVPMFLGATVAGPVVELPQSSFGTVPTGGIIPFVGTSATPPAGWLFCDGASVSRTTYAALFALCGGSFGTVTGSTFVLPDLRGRVPAGPDGGSGRLTNLSNVNVGSFGGAQDVGITVAQMPSHNHIATVTDNGHDHGIQLSNSGLSGTGSGSVTQNVDTGSRTNGNFTGVGVTIQSTGSDAHHNNVQPTLMLNYIIKT